MAIITRKSGFILVHCPLSHCHVDREEGGEGVEKGGEVRSSRRHVASSMMACCQLCHILRGQQIKFRTFISPPHLSLSLPLFLSLSLSLSLFISSLFSLLNLQSNVFSQHNLILRICFADFFICKVKIKTLIGFLVNSTTYRTQFHTSC